MNKFEVMRMDLLTRKKFPREQLFRLVLKEGILTLDPSDRMPGRGIYVKKDQQTIETIFQKKMLYRYGSKTDFEALKKELLSLC